MGVFNLKSKAAQVEVMCDLDHVIEREIGFVFKGETHYLEPITTERFIRFAKGLIEIQKEQESADRVMELYLAMIQSVCKSFTAEHVKQLTQAQAIVLFTHIANKIMGRSERETEDEKKN